MAYKVALALAAAQAVSAHFGLIYPEWRADTLTDDENSTYNQWDYPCTFHSSLNSPRLCNFKPNKN